MKNQMMTLPEIRNCLDRALWLESIKDQTVDIVLLSSNDTASVTFVDRKGNFWQYPDATYGKEWKCWAKCPTTEETFTPKPGACMIFTHKGKVLLRYSLKGSFPEEKENTIQLLAYEKNIPTEEIETTIINP
jgi:hypothetical protein